MAVLLKITAQCNAVQRSSLFIRMVIACRSVPVKQNKRSPQERLPPSLFTAVAANNCHCAFFCGQYAVNKPCFVCTVRVVVTGRVKHPVEGSAQCVPSPRCDLQFLTDDGPGPFAASLPSPNLPYHTTRLSETFKSSIDGSTILLWDRCVP